MAQDVYELEVLLKLRERARDQAQEDAASALTEQARCQAHVLECEAARERALAQRKRESEAFDNQCASGQVGIAQMQQFGDYLRALTQKERALAQDIERAEHEVELAREEVARAQAALTQAAKQLKAVQSHREGWQQEQDQLARRRQDAAMDEIASRRWREQQ